MRRKGGEQVVCGKNVKPMRAKKLTTFSGRMRPAARSSNASVVIAQSAFSGQYLTSPHVASTSNRNANVFNISVLPTPQHIRVSSKFSEPRAKSGLPLAPRNEVTARSAASSSQPETAALSPALITGSYIAMWYSLNIAFNLTNKTIFGFFPFPWTVSTVHVVVGSIYCAITYFLGLKKASFGRPITKEEFKTILFPASMHGLGHIAANISFAAVAISLTHTVKTLEPVFNVAMTKLVLGTTTSLPVGLSLVPITLGVAAASASELSFNWTGFISAMLSNLTFSFRAVYSKKAMSTIKDLDSTAIYAYTTLISMVICVPLALFFEGPRLAAGATAAIAKVGAFKFYSSLLSVGLLYHLYNQFAFNTLGRVNPVSHGVCNVVKRIAIIGSSVMFFGNKLTLQTKLGTAIALLGTALYTELKNRESKK